MTRKRPPAQDTLPLTGGARYRPGTVERAVQADVRQLRAMELLPPGVEALVQAYRLVGREFDRSERELDRWGKLGAARELRSLREDIGSLAPLPIDDEFDDQIERLAAALRDAPPA